MGALVHYIVHTQAVPFQPMNINFGLFPPVKGRGRKRKQLQATRALEDLKRWKEEVLQQ
jgi:methylenetetrahydrofolate--tRNA-(uracil-5-)-methyltransferase